MNHSQFIKKEAQKIGDSLVDSPGCTHVAVDLLFGDDLCDFNRQMLLGILNRLLEHVQGGGRDD